MSPEKCYDRFFFFLVISVHSVLIILSRYQTRLDSHTNPHPASVFFTQKVGPISSSLITSSRQLLKSVHWGSVSSSPLFFKQYILKGSWSNNKDRWWQCERWGEKVINVKEISYKGNYFWHNMFYVFCVCIWNCFSQTVWGNIAKWNNIHT